MLLRNCLKGIAMKMISMVAVLICTAFTGSLNKPVENMDMNRYAGVWYSLYSIPTFFDKNTRETTGHYTWSNKGYYEVVTTYKKGEDADIHSVKSKVFPVEGASKGELKAQFIWPYKVDYWVIELAADYSYVVVGHPDYKYLFIMSRKPGMSPQLYNEIVARCKAKGYPVEKLVSQQQPGNF